MAKYAKPKSTNAASTKKKNSTLPWLIGAGVFFILLIVVIVMISNSGSSTADIAPPDVPEEWVSRTVLGNPDAPITVQAWEDFMCPACQQWNSQVKPNLFRDYIQTGDVKLVFRHFPLQMHAPGAEMGAMASECAADQDAFWPYHDRLFLEAANRGQAGMQVERLIDYADEMGLDKQQFQQCIASQQHRDAVTASVTEAITMQLGGTPTIIVNDQVVPSDYSTLKAQIDAQLEAANAGN